MSDARSGPKLKPPSAALMFAEARSLLELNASLMLSPLLMTAPRGDGHPVLALPGFLASDISTSLLRRYVGLLGYEPHAWDLGRNFGGVYRMRQLLRDRLAFIADAAGRKVSLVGWSLGGVYARDLALSMPEAVRSVDHARQPVRQRHLRLQHAQALRDAVGRTASPTPSSRTSSALAGDLAVPATSIFTKTDGIVHWRTCLLQGERRTRKTSRSCSPATPASASTPPRLWAIADRLAQPEGTFRPFNRMGPFMLAYGRPESGDA